MRRRQLSLELEALREVLQEMHGHSRGQLRDLQDPQQPREVHLAGTHHPVGAWAAARRQGPSAAQDLVLQQRPVLGREAHQQEPQARQKALLRTAARRGRRPLPLGCSAPAICPYWRCAPQPENVSCRALFGHSCRSIDRSGKPRTKAKIKCPNYF